MGTRSLTFVYDEQGEKIINLYRQFDGYPTGHGVELAEFLNEVKHNGSGCLAAQLVSFFKKEPMNFYLHSTKVEDCGQDYEYHIYTGASIRVKIMYCGWNVFGMTQDDTYEPLFFGDVEQFTKYCSSEKYGDAEINAPAQTFENSIIGQEVLKKELKEGVVTVVFEKQDGTERTMKCTLSDDIVPLMDTTAVKRKRIQNPDVLAVWDIDNNGWRSFRFDSIKSVTFPCVVSEQQSA